MTGTMRELCLPEWVLGDQAERFTVSSCGWPFVLAGTLKVPDDLRCCGRSRPSRPPEECWHGPGSEGYDGYFGEMVAGAGHPRRDRRHPLAARHVLRGYRLSSRLATNQSVNRWRRAPFAVPTLRNVSCRAKPLDQSRHPRAVSTDSSTGSRRGTSPFPCTRRSSPACARTCSGRRHTLP
jgi:hypothetical protein